MIRSPTGFPLGGPSGSPATHRLDGKVLNNIGIAGGVGFGVGVAPVIPNGFTLLSSTPGQDNYGNYQYTDGSVMCWVPLFYYRIGHVDNPTYAAYGVNSVDILPESTFADETAANAAGYALHRAFKDGGAVKRGFMVDKYMCSKNASGAGYIASSVKNGLPISAHPDHNPIADLTSCAGNNYFYAIDAAHARDGVDGAVNPASVFFCSSRFIIGALALLSMAHGQAATAADNCAWYDAGGATNFPKGCNNNALSDVNDTSVVWESYGYSSCGKTGAAGYGGGAGNEFAKSTHNGQACGVADLNGLMWEISLGVTCVTSGVRAIEGISRANPAVVTLTAHGMETGDTPMLTAIGTGDWAGLANLMYVVTRISDNQFSLDGIDTSAYSTAYDAGVNGGTITHGTWYAAAEETAMADFTSGNSSATDHWGATGVASMMVSFAPAFAGSFVQRFGGGASQVLSGDMSGNNWMSTGLGMPANTDGFSSSGSNLYGQDYYFQYVSNELCLLSGAYWANYAAAGVWAAAWSNSRAGSSNAVGFRLACYPV